MDPFNRGSAVFFSLRPSPGCFSWTEVAKQLKLSQMSTSFCHWKSRRRLKLLNLDLVKVIKLLVTKKIRCCLILTLIRTLHNLSRGIFSRKLVFLYSISINRAWMRYLSFIHTIVNNSYPLLQTYVGFQVYYWIRIFQTISHRTIKSITCNPITE